MDKSYFLKRAYEVHGNEYTYEKVTDAIKNNKDKIVVTCPKHGDFVISIVNFLNGRKCPLCNKERRGEKFKDEYFKIFVNKATKIHNNKYDYSKVDYVDMKTKVCIICPEHGEFWQTPYAHLIGEGCPLCSHRSFKYTKDEFIKKAREIHGNKYDYSKVDYVNMKTKVCIICPEHGEFWQTPEQHLKGHGCKKCGIKTIWEKRERKTKEQFINELESKFGKIYKYDLIEWKDCHTKIKLIYNGKIIEETPTKFLCAEKPITYERVRNTEDFIKKAKLIHGNRYDYSKTIYKNQNTPVVIICPEHGEFKINPWNHLNGSGCRLCRMSNLEMRVMQYLKDYKIKYEYQKYPNFLSKGLSHQSLDFYLPDYNIAIECQGGQHFKNNGLYQCLEENIKRDIKKNKKCGENKVQILYFLDRHIKKKSIINNTDFGLIYTKENTIRDSKNGLKELIEKIINK